MGSQRLLNVEPRKLSFTFELGKPASCIIRLYNNSGVHVAYKVMTTSPAKYAVRPKMDILLPGSGRDVKVTMLGPKEVPSNMQCKDKFLIKSVVASPDDNVESSSRLFNEGGRVVEVCKLRVVYASPTHQQSSDFGRSGAGFSPNASASQERNLNNPEQQGTSGWHVGDQFMKGIKVVLLCLVFWFLIRMMLPLIWSVGFMITVLLMKMTTKLVSENVEDWIAKTLLYISIHIFSVVFRRRKRRPDNDS